MILAYYSRTGNTADFVDWYMLPILGEGFEARSIELWDADQPYILFTPTYNFGEVPEEVEEWLADNKEHIQAVVSSGNRNWGNKMFARSGNLVQAIYRVPLLGKYELKGNPQDAENIKDQIKVYLK